MTSCHRALLDAHLVEPGSADTAQLARHREGAGEADAGFEAYLLAADQALAVAAYAEEAALLLRAWQLRPRVSDTVAARHGTEAELAVRIAFSVRRGGDEPGARQVVDDAAERLAQEPDALVRAAVLRMQAQMVPTGDPEVRSDRSAALLRRALEECRTCPPSGEQAHVLAELASVLTVQGDSENAAAVADQAIAMSREVDDRFVLAFALGARSRVHLLLGEEAAAHRTAEDASSVALASGRPEAQGLAAISRGNVLEVTGRWPETADLLAEARDHAAAGGLRGLVQMLGGYAALFLAYVGRLDEAEESCRRILPGGRGGGATAVVARQAALVLAVRQGRPALAEMQAARLGELMPGTGTADSYSAATWAEFRLATGSAQQALRTLSEEIGALYLVAEPLMADLLLVWAARAAADVAMAGEREAAITGLEAAVQARAGLGVPFADADRNPVDAAWQALFAAESARCRGEEGQPEHWATAIEASRAAGLRYEEAGALLARSRLLLGARSTRAEGVADLRASYRLALAMGAGGLLRQSESLARTARVSLAEPGDPGRLAVPDEVALTRREREVLSHLVAGRTYAEIAAALFISEKTVSVHVSNLLRKTGTGNRVDAADWAERHGVAPVEGPGT